MNIEDYHAHYGFIKESNRIEGILREPSEAEVVEHARFMTLEAVTVEELISFVKVYQPDAVLRTKSNLNVRVGNYYPPPGGSHIRKALEKLLAEMHEVGSYQTHVAFETLHPFSDCNGRSGRMLWMWQMKTAPLRFLQSWYYQSLASSRN